LSDSTVSQLISHVTMVFVVITTTTNKFRKQQQQQIKTKQKSNK